jgi:ribonuclease HI
VTVKALALFLPYQTEKETYRSLAYYIYGLHIHYMYILHTDVRVYHTYNSLYTDGSKDADKVAAAAVTRSSTLQCRLPDRASIFTAEIQAILLALDHIAKSSDSHFIIFSDSKSCLQAIANLKLEHPLIMQTLEKLNSRKLIGKYIIFCWLPSHIGIKGNEEADAAAKAALQRPVSNIRIPHSDFKPYTNLMTDIWQNSWNKK